MADTATQLAEAQAALHKLMTNGQAVSVTINGRSITYDVQSREDLRAYVSELESKLATESNSTKNRRRPFGIIY